MTRTIAVIGAGFSGTLTALHLLERGLRVRLIERSEGFGPGLAYGEGHAGHLLNVRAGNMSAYPEQTNHLLDWLVSEGLNADPAGFVRRSDYGRYIQTQLRTAATGPRAAGRLNLVRDEAVAVYRTTQGLDIALAKGRALSADAAVLALGAFPPRRPNGLFDAQYVADPWAPFALDGIGPDTPVVVLGSGLTMVDVIAKLRAREHSAPMVALSRRGRLPHRHSGSPGPAQEIPAPGSLSQRLWRFRKSAKADWRAAFDGLRPHTISLWNGLDKTERRRFLRHLRPFWEVHRHRLAPAVADQLDGWIASGVLAVTAGQLVRADARAVTWRPRGQTGVCRLAGAVLINATGPDVDVTQAPSALLAQLLASGRTRPDALRLGLDTTADGRLLGADGSVQSGLFAIGPLTRATIWESTAVPDLRVQAANLAKSI